MNAEKLIIDYMSGEMEKHMLFAAGRRCACGHQFRLNPNRYSRLVTAHHKHVATVMSHRLLSGVMIDKKFLARDGADATGESPLTLADDRPHAADPPVRAGEKVN